MKIAVIGANGKAGKLIVREALSRGHEVVAIVRDKGKIDEDIHVIEKDVLSINVDDLHEVDVVVNAMGAGVQDPIIYKIATKYMIDVLMDLPSVRYIVVGGAGSLFTNATMESQLYTTDQFPKSIYPVGMNMAKALDLLRDSRIMWTFFSPAIQFDATGKRSGEYTLGTEWIILNQTGESYISYPDYAIALMDEIEKSQFICKRFTAVSER